jgi:hypothetical protein
MVRAQDMPLTSAFLYLGTPYLTANLHLLRTVLRCHHGARRKVHQVELDGEVKDIL